MAKYNILSACGTGVATSTVASSKCKKLLAARGLEDVNIIECKALEVVGKAKMMKPDCIIHTAEIPTDQLEGFKTFRAIQFITSIGENELADEISEYLKSLNK